MINPPVLDIQNIIFSNAFKIFNHGNKVFLLQLFLDFSLFLQLSEEDRQQLLKIFQTLQRHFFNPSLLGLIRTLVREPNAFPSICQRSEYINLMQDIQQLIFFLEKNKNERLSNLEIDLHNFEPQWSYPIKVALHSMLEMLRMFVKFCSIRSTTKKRQVQILEQSTPSASTNSTGL